MVDALRNQGSRADLLVEVNRRLDYFNRLDTIDRMHVTGLITFADRILTPLMPDGVQIAVIAVGSTTQPDIELHHAPRDIDLRFLNSAPSGTDQRKGVVEFIRGAIRNYLIRTHIKCDLNTHLKKKRTFY